MNTNEHRQLIDEVGGLLDTQGLGFVHADALRAARGSDFSGQFCARYLEAVASDLEARSRRAYSLAIAEAREYMATSDRDTIEDIVVRLDGAEEQLEGRAEVSLSESIDFTELTSALREVSTAVRDDPTPL